MSSGSCSAWSGLGLALPPSSATEELQAVLEEGPERQPAAVDPRLDGAEGHARHVGDLGVVEALDVVQDDGHALVVGDAGERTGQDARPLGADRSVLGIRLDTGGWLPALDP